MFLKPEECSKLLLWADSCWQRSRGGYPERRSTGGLAGHCRGRVFCGQAQVKSQCDPVARGGPRTGDMVVWGQHRPCPPVEQRLPVCSTLPAESSPVPLPYAA